MFRLLLADAALLAFLLLLAFAQIQVALYLDSVEFLRPIGPLYFTIFVRGIMGNVHLLCCPIIAIIHAYLIQRIAGVKYAASILVVNAFAFLVVSIVPNVVLGILPGIPNYFYKAQLLLPPNIMCTTITQVFLALLFFRKGSKKEG